MKNNLTVDVILYNQVVGILSWDDSRQLANFQFYPSFIKNGWDVAPVIMPLNKYTKDRIYSFPANRNECFKGLPGLIADALPDKYGNQIIDEWFAAHGLSGMDITPLDRLCYIGNRAMGAMEFHPSKNIKGLNDSTILRMDTLVELADKVYRDRLSFRQNILQQDKAILDILKIGTSAGGAKPKAIIALNEKTNEIRSGQVKAPEGFTYWLMKFDGTTFQENGYKIDHPKGISNIEYAYYKMATDCQIKMTDCRLLQEGDSFHFMTKRFDRTDDGEKIHMQTLAAMAHYDRDSRHSYEEAFQIFRKIGLNYNDYEQFFRRMVFNIVARNHDDHTKNHSFLMDNKGRWTLAPAYDLCYSYSPEGRWTSRHQMSANGKQDEFCWEDLQTVGERMDIKKYDIIIEEIVDYVSQWSSYAKNCGVYDKHAELIKDNLRLLNKPHNIANKIDIHHPEENKITDIAIFESGSDYKISCKINGVRQLGLKLSLTEKILYKNTVENGIQPEIERLKQNLVEKYFAQSDNIETSKTFKR